MSVDRLDNEMAHNWHVAINRFHDGKAGSRDWQHWMYEAKDLADEVPRMVLLFGREREGKLPKVHRQCSRSGLEEVVDNHLTCCLGVECRTCEFLFPLEQSDLTPTERDMAKAWTCATHILTKGGDVAKEGYLMTVDDRMFWDKTYDSMAANGDDEAEPLPRVSGTNDGKER